MINIKLVYYIERCKMCIRFNNEEEYRNKKDYYIEIIKNKNCKKLILEYKNSNGEHCKEIIFKR